MAINIVPLYLSYLPHRKVKKKKPTKKNYPTYLISFCSDLPVDGGEPKVEPRLSLILEANRRNDNRPFRKRRVRVEFFNVYSAIPRNLIHRELMTFFRGRRVSIHRRFHSLFFGRSRTCRWPDRGV